MSRSRAQASSRRKKRLHWWNRGTGVRLRLWMAFNIVVLSALSYGVYVLVQSNAAPAFIGLGQDEKGVGVVDRLKSGGETTVPARSQFLAPDGVHFGVSTYEAPYSTSETDAVAKAAGSRPTLTEFFVKWSEDYDPKAVDAAYRQGMLPLLSWEPWAGEAAGLDQPDYSLASIADGTHDAYIEKFARSVATQKWPLVLRFAHEMNGNWYPWSEQRSGNKPGQYTAAWQHVHDLFEKAGADNVIWLWSPNILRPVPDISIKALYPGDQYVDWAGMVGYGVEEDTAAKVFDPTLKALKAVTDRPILISETGAQPGSLQAGWTTSFFTWLREHPEVIGFVWFQRSEQEGGGADWRFTTSAATQKAFRTGLAGLDLVSATSRRTGG